MTGRLDSLLARLRLRLLDPLSRRAGAFWRWWSGHIAETLPAGLREALASKSSRVELQVEDDELIVTARSAQGDGELARLNLGDAKTPEIELPESVSEVLLCLPRDSVLQRSLSLPLAAEENLREVLSFEIDRQTPFSKDQVYFDFFIRSRDSRESTMRVDLVVVPRNMVDDLLRRLAGTGLTPGVVTTAERREGGLLPVNLLPDEKRARRGVAWPRLNTLLALLCVLLLATALLSPLWLSQQRVQRLEAEQAAIQDLANDALGLRREVESLTKASAFLVEKKQSSVLVLEVLDEVSRVLPDDTWLTELRIDAPEIQLQGQSEAASDLVQLFESSPMFENARFRSPVVQIPRTNTERFQLSVELQEAASE